MSEATDPALRVVEMQHRRGDAGWRAWVRRWTPLAIFLGAIGGAVPLAPFAFHAINWPWATKAELGEIHHELHELIDLVRPGASEQIHHRAAKSREE